MKLPASTLLLFLVSLALALVGLIATVRPDLAPAVPAGSGVWFVLAAYGVLTLSVLARSL